MAVKKRTIVGGLVGAGVLLGLFLSQWWPNFNLGGFGLGGRGSVVVSTGESTPGEEVPRIATPPKDDSSSEEPASDETTLAISGEEPAESAPTADSVLHILIDGRQYLVKRPVAGGEEYQPVSVEQLVELARESKPNDDGIRVRISRRGSARATAEMALGDRLLEAGLTRESIRWQEGLVPRPDPARPEDQGR